YKAAKQMQAVLNRRKMEVEKELSRAQGTDFSGADASGVNIGTVVQMTGHGGKPVEYTVLGAWDSDPEKNIVSYLSDIGQALIGHKVGDEVEFRDLETEQSESHTITAIKPYR
ncbi:MAG: transcription elongation factor GreA, partial [Akkermansiaceae bacterium]|nr:transcription elongation factor GreA [Akkermansiaceae bacterium]